MCSEPSYIHTRHHYSMQTTPIEIILRIQNPKIPREESDSRKKRSASNILRVYRREIKSHEQHLHGGLRSIMAKDPIISIPYEPGWILEGLTKQTYPILEWIFLYEHGSAITKIAKQYHVGGSTVYRRLVENIALRDRISASITASSKYAKKPFWQALIKRIKSEVIDYRESAKLGYIQKHGSIHPRDEL